MIRATIPFLGAVIVVGVPPAEVPAMNGASLFNGNPAVSWPVLGGDHGRDSTQFAIVDALWCGGDHGKDQVSGIKGGGDHGKG